MCLNSQRIPKIVREIRLAKRSIFEKRQLIFPMEASYISRQSAWNILACHLTYILDLCLHFRQQNSPGGLFNSGNSDISIFFFLTCFFLAHHRGFRFPEFVRRGQSLRLHWSTSHHECMHALISQRVVHNWFFDSFEQWNIRSPQTRSSAVTPYGIVGAMPPWWPSPPRTVKPHGWHPCRQTTYTGASLRAPTYRWLACMVPFRSNCNHDHMHKWLWIKDKDKKR